MADNSNYLPKDFFRTSHLIYALSGIFLFTPKDVSLRRKVLEYTWSFVIYIPSAYYSFLELWRLTESIHDIKEFLNQAGIFLTHLLGIAKVILLVVGHKKMQELENILLDDRFYYEAHGDFQPAGMINEAKKISSVVSITLYFLYSCVGYSALIATDIALNIFVKEDGFPSGVTCSDFIQYYFHIPWNSDTKTKCRLTNLFMGYNIACYAFFIACHDGHYAAILNCMRAQLRILCGAINTIRPRVYERLNLSKTYEIFSDTQYPKLETELYEELKKCNRHMNELRRAAYEMEDLFTFMILGQTTSSIVIMASILFYATSMPLTSPAFFSQMEYFGCIFIQLFVFCWFGSGVTDASEELNNSLYCCDWYSSSRRYKSSMIIMMTRMQTPIRLTIGKFSPLTLNAIVAVTKASVSYFTVFKSVGIEEI